MEKHILWKIEQFENITYYPRLFLEQYKYIGKEKKVSRFINDDLEISCDGSDK